MRGELGTRLDNFTNRGTTPSSTPSTASTNRQNPPNYQRMLSNGSDKENCNGSVTSRAPEWLDSPLVATKKLKNQANRFPKSSSPARQWLSPGRTGRSIPLLKNQVQTTMPHSNNRRSSAAGITHRPPTYPQQQTIKTRSQSLDGLLDVATATNTTSNQINQIAEGASDVNTNRLNNSDIENDKKNEIEESSSKRKSKSMEDLLDSEIRNEEIRAKSEDTKISSSTSLEQPREEEIIIIDNSKSCEELDKTADDLNNKFIRQESTNSLPVKGKNTFLNRYVKKVKSFIKKWQKFYCIFEYRCFCPK